MGMITVRLSDEDAAKASELRQLGMEVSQIVREAIRTEYDRRTAQRKQGDTAALLDAIYKRHPEPAGVHRPVPSTLDRKAFARHVRGRLSQKVVR